MLLMATVRSKLRLLLLCSIALARHTFALKTAAFPNSIRVQRALSSPASESFAGEFFDLVGSTVKCGGSAAKLLQPSPCLLVARDMTEGRQPVAVAQLARIGSGYLYLQKVCASVASRNSTLLRAQS
jgi:hypothetical protein